MRVFQKQMWFALAAIALIMTVTPPSKAQLNSGASPVALNATMAESLTVSLSAAAVNFALVPSGTVAGSTTVGVTTTWALAPGRTNLALYAYFASATALNNGANIIPTANFLGNINAGAFSPYTGGTAPALFGGVNGKTVFTNALPVGGSGGTRVDTLGFQINTTGLSLPALVYTGTLNIQAQAI